MKKFFRRTSLLLAAAFLGAATMQAQKSLKTWTALSMR